MIDLILLPILALVVLSFRKQAANEDYLSIEKCNCLRGMLAVFIVLHHMSEKISGGYLFPQLQHLGYLIVAVFFFLSGYGLMVSYQKKGEAYFKGYWKNRIGYLLVVYLIVSVIYLIYFNIVGQSIGLIQFAKSFISGYPTATFSWYIIVQLLFYVIFLFVFSICKRFNNGLKILTLMALTLAMMIGFYYAGYDSFWYLSDIAFVIGVIYAKYRDKIDSVLSKNIIMYLVALVFCFGGFAVFSIVPSIAARLGFEADLIYWISRNISSSFFALIIVVTFYKLNLKSKIWAFLGGISLEIYLFHGMMINIFKSIISNEILWIITVILTSVAVAFIASLANKQISKLIKGK